MSYSTEAALAARLERIAALSDAQRHRLLELLCESAPGVVEASLVLLDDDGGAIAPPRPPAAGPAGRGRHRSGGRGRPS